LRWKRKTHANEQEALIAANEEEALIPVKGQEAPIAVKEQEASTTVKEQGGPISTDEREAFFVMLDDAIDNPPSSSASSQIRHEGHSAV
jgi:hypothetical protein